MSEGGDSNVPVCDRGSPGFVRGRRVS
jgi:hypothetical protein